MIYSDVVYFKQDHGTLLILALGAKGNLLNLISQKDYQYIPIVSSSTGPDTLVYRWRALIDKMIINNVYSLEKNNYIIPVLYLLISNKYNK